MDGFGEMRSMVDTIDDVERAKRWPKLIDFMQRNYKEAPQIVEEQWLPYALRAVEAWPSHIRYAPREWVNAIKRGEEIGPILALAQGLDATRMTNPRFQDICASPGFEWVKHLRFGNFDFKLKSGKALGASKSLRNLESLTFRWTLPGALKINAALSNDFAADLKTLTFIQCPITENVLRKIGSGRLESLETLRLQGASWYELDWSVLSEMQLPSIRRLELSDTWTVGDTLAKLADAPWAGQLEEIVLHGGTYVGYSHLHSQDEATRREAQYAQQLYTRRRVTPDQRASMITDHILEHYDLRARFLSCGMSEETVDAAIESMRTEWRDESAYWA